jgi:hypothetical protein
MSQIRWIEKRGEEEKEKRGERENIHRHIKHHPMN